MIADQRLTTDDSIATVNKGLDPEECLDNGSSIRMFLTVKSSLRRGTERPAIDRSPFDA